MNLNNSYELSQDQKIKPDVTYCGPGYHWDYILKKCVPDNCPEGYHYDPTMRTCVVNGGGSGGTIISYAGVNITYYISSHTIGFNNASDVNTVLNQLDNEYENYNIAYENQYPNYTSLQLDSLDSVKNFDQLKPYRDFEAKFAGYTSERLVFENNETTWLNNNTIGSDPDSLDYTVDNSVNAICNNNYQLIIAGTTYQWTSTGLITVGGTPSMVVNAFGSCFSNYRGGPPSWFFNGDRTRKCKLKVAVNECIIRGEAKAKVKSFRKKSNGKWVRSRLDLNVKILGPLLYINTCTLFKNENKISPAQGYLKRYELKVLDRLGSGQSQIYMNTFTGSFNSNISGLSGFKTL